MNRNVFLAILLLASLFVLTCGAFAQSAGEMVKAPTEKARVFVTDSQSWEMRGGGGGSSQGFGGGNSGGARPQTAEIIKTFGERDNHRPAVAVVPGSPGMGIGQRRRY